MVFYSSWRHFFSTFCSKYPVLKQNAKNMNCLHNANFFSHSFHTRIVLLPVKKVKAHRAYKSNFARENCIQKHTYTCGLDETYHCETDNLFCHWTVKYYDLRHIFVDILNTGTHHSIVLIVILNSSPPKDKFSIQQDLVSQLLK